MHPVQALSNGAIGNGIMDPSATINPAALSSAGRPPSPPRRGDARREPAIVARPHQISSPNRVVTALRLRYIRCRRPLITVLTAVLQVC